MINLFYSNVGDIENWMTLVEKFRQVLPGLETSAAMNTHRATVLRFMGDRQAICAKDGQEIVGVLLFSRKQNMICCLGVSPDRRRQGIASLLLVEALRQLDRTKPITVHTFRSDDTRSKAPRSLYEKHGFIAEELLEDMDHPTQLYTLYPLVLIEPNEKYLSSYIEAYDEYSKYSVTTYGLSDARSYDIFDKFDRFKNERGLNPNRFGSDFYWLVDERKGYFIGEVAIRHRLNDALWKRGGHIGYGVRYSEWNKGYGTLLLKLALEKARERGITDIMITCNDDNYGSAKVMENNGMVLMDKIENNIDGKTIITRRYILNMEDKL